MEFSEKMEKGRAERFTEKDLGNKKKHRPKACERQTETHVTRVLKKAWPLRVNGC